MTVLDFAMSVPETPPQRSAKFNVGVAVVPYEPKARNRSALPSCMKLAGIVTFGTRIVSAVVLATAVAVAVAQASASDQNCLLIVQYLAV